MTGNGRRLRALAALAVAAVAALPVGMLAPFSRAAAAGAGDTGLAPDAAVVPAVWRQDDDPGTLTIEPGAGRAAILIEAYVIGRDGAARLAWRRRWAQPGSMQLPREPFAAPGFYRISLRRELPRAPARWLTIGVAPKALTRGAGAPLFGINTHFAQREIPDAAYSLLRLANADLVRDQWVWSAVERRPGRLLAPAAPNGGLARVRDRLRQAGLRILHDCAYTNPLYDGGAFPRSPAAVAAFARYCAFVAAQLGPTLYGSEIWNEPNGVAAATGYAPLVAAAAQSLRAAAPDAAILQGAGGGAGGGADPFFEETVFRTLGAGCCTGASMHPYMTNPDVGYFAANSRLLDPVTDQAIVNMRFVTFWSDYLSHLMKLERGSNFTELGWSSAESVKSGVPEDKQAAYTERALILATIPSACTRAVAPLAADLAAVCAPAAAATVPDLRTLFIYDLQDDGDDNHELEQNFGLVHADLTPKMAFSAFAQAAGTLRGLSFDKRFVFGPRSLANAVLYRREDGDPRAWLVLWTAEFRPQSRVTSAAQLDYPPDQQTQATLAITGLPAGSSARPIVCREWDGRPCHIDPARVAIGNLPLYLQIAAPIASIDVHEIGLSAKSYDRAGRRADGG